MIGNDDDARPGHEPERVEAEEGIVEAALLGVVLQGEEGGVDEHAPAGGAEQHLKRTRDILTSTRSSSK